MKSIDKGDIVSSGAPQIAKDGRTSTDFTQSRRTKLGRFSLPRCFKMVATHFGARINFYWHCIVLAGSREDIPHGLDDYKDDSADNSRVGSVEGSSYERNTHYHGTNLKMEALWDHKTFSDNKFKSEGISMPK